MYRRGYIDKILSQNAHKYDDDLRKLGRELQANDPKKAKMNKSFNNPFPKGKNKQESPMTTSSYQNLTSKETAAHSSKSREPMSDLINELLSMVLFLNKLKECQVKFLEVFKASLRKLIPSKAEEIEPDLDLITGRLSALDGGAINSHLIMINEKICKIGLSNFGSLLNLSPSTRHNEPLGDLGKPMSKQVKGVQGIDDPLVTPNLKCAEELKKQEGRYKNSRKEERSNPFAHKKNHSLACLQEQVVQTPEVSKIHRTSKEKLDRNISQNQRKLQRITNNSSFLFREPGKDITNLMSMERQFEKPRFHKNSPYKYIEKSNSIKIQRKHKSKSDANEDNFETSKVVLQSKDYLFEQSKFINKILDFSKSQNLSNASEFLSPAPPDRLAEKVSHPSEVRAKKPYFLIPD